MTVAEGAKASEATENSDDETVNDDQTDPKGKETAPDRLLKESKKFKDRALKAEKELSDLKAKEATKQGEFRALYESTKADYDTLKKSSVKKAVNSAVKEEALKHGCVDPDALLALGNRELLTFDDESQEISGADAFVEDLKKSKPYLFGKKSSAVINGTTPNGLQKPKKVTAADIAKMPDGPEKTSLWLQAMQNQK